MTIASPADSASLAAALSALVADPSRVIDNPQVVDRLSRDFYWYSPVLKKLLDGKRGDVVVQPVNVEEVQSVLAYCYEHEIPVTARGSGTGNYGQAVPLHGGVVLDLQRMDQIEADQRRRRRPNASPAFGSRCSRPRRASLDGSCAAIHRLWSRPRLEDFSEGALAASVRLLTAVCAISTQCARSRLSRWKPQPRVLKYEGEKVHDILHAWGTNGIITRIWLALAPAVDWAQCAVAFDTFDAAFTFAETIANSGEWTKRLVTVFEWPIPSFFAPVKHLVREGKALIFFMIAGAQMDAFKKLATAVWRRSSLSLALMPASRPRPLLSDYTWNHTTLWAIRSRCSYTYLQCGFDPVRVREQFAELKRRFGDDLLFHIEFMKNRKRRHHSGLDSGGATSQPKSGSTK